MSNEQGRKTRYMEKKKDAAFLQNTRKPLGEDGKKMLEIMNGGHHEVLANWGLSQIEINPGSDMLDAGCGGGANLKRLLAKCPDGHVTGIDYSFTSVKVSISVNEKNIKAGMCDVFMADINGLPFEDCSFDFVSAFETVYFWPTVEHAFGEVFRVLRKGGMFFICNESDGRDQSSIDNSKIISGMKLYTPEDLEGIMAEAGFREINHFSNPELSHIVVCGIK